MKIGLGREPGNEVPLPIEIIEVIAAYVARQKHASGDRQTALWRLCLVGKNWYSATVKHLYSRPALTSRNFDLFTRTICPPVSSRARVIGLEDLVEHLYMGDLAYITNKATTARLLRRTRKALRTFVAPSYSMSIASLAPISKLQQITYLDLSRDSYDFNIIDLLRALQSSNSLHFLSLPQSILTSYPTSELAWPQELAYLEINSTIPRALQQWEKFLTHLPDSLQHISFLDIRPMRRDGQLAADVNVSAPQVSSLLIKSQYPDDRGAFNFAFLLQSFPGIETLSFQWTSMEWGTLIGTASRLTETCLQELIIQHATTSFSNVVPEIDARFIMDLCEIVAKSPDFHRLEMPQSLANVNGETMQPLNTALEERWRVAPTQDSGVFITDASGNSARWKPGD